MVIFYALPPNPHSIQYLRVTDQARYSTVAYSVINVIEQDVLKAQSKIRIKMKFFREIPLCSKEVFQQHALAFRYCGGFSTDYDFRYPWQLYWQFFDPLKIVCLLLLLFCVCIRLCIIFPSPLEILGVKTFLVNKS